MKKKWNIASWEIRLIYLYWLIPTTILFIAFIYMLIMFFLTDINGLWRLPLSVLASEYKLMPVITSLDISFTFMSIFGAYYGWRLLQGSGMARNFLETISWLTIIYSSIIMIFPELKYIEVQSAPPEINNPPIIWAIIGWLFLTFEVFILFLLRKESVKNYANIF